MLRHWRHPWPMMASWTLCAASWLAAVGCTFDGSNLQRVAREAAAEQQDVGPEVVRDDVQGGRAEVGRGGTDLMPHAGGLVEAGSEVGPSDVARDAKILAKDGGSSSDAQAANEDVARAVSADGGEDTKQGGGETDLGTASIIGDAADTADRGPMPDANAPMADASPSNLAFAGTAYRWSGNSSSTANANRVAEIRLNDDSTATEINLAGSGWDQVQNAWEAAGVILARAATVTRVVFVNGSFSRQTIGGITYSGDGNFAANFHLQLSTDGTVWTDATGWSLSPAYPYDSSASNGSYVFSGNATSVLGVRVTGQVRLGNSLDVSWNATSREVQVWGYN